MMSLFHGQTSIYLDCSGAKPTRLGMDEKGGLTPAAYESETTVFRKHLFGRRPIGVYPTVGEHVLWSCIDLDYVYTEDDAWMVWAKWLELGSVVSWVETSKSKGYHIWVFFEDWVEAGIARDAGLAVIQECGLPGKIEVNPKQTVANDADTPPETRTGWGNCVRLPYPGWGSNPGRNTMLDSNGAPLGLAEFLAEELSTSRATEEQALQVASFLKPPLPSMASRLADIGTGPGSTYPARTGGRPGSLSDSDCARIYRGEMDIRLGSRDNQLWSLANYLRGIGLDQGQAEQAMAEAWTRMENPGNDFISEAAAMAKIRRVY
jgi:hypothetical protein